MEFLELYHSHKFNIANDFLDFYGVKEDEKKVLLEDTDFISQKRNPKKTHK